MADPDAGEVLQNTVQATSSASATARPSSSETRARPNLVAGNAIAQCGFDVFSPDPYYDDGGPQRISIKTG